MESLYVGKLPQASLNSTQQSLQIVNFVTRHFNWLLKRVTLTKFTFVGMIAQHSVAMLLCYVINSLKWPKVASTFRCHALFPEYARAVAPTHAPVARRWTERC